MSEYLGPPPEALLLPSPLALVRKPGGTKRGTFPDAPQACSESNDRIGKP